EQIAEQIEFLGGSIFSGAGWNNSSVSVSVTKDKLDKAMDILADVVLNPTFPQDELDLLKTQYLDGLTYSLTQPGFLSNYVASKYSYREHPAGGTPQSIETISRDDVVKFYTNAFASDLSTIIFSGDINQKDADILSTRMFGQWAIPQRLETGSGGGTRYGDLRGEGVLNRFLVIDLPHSGQASVTYHKQIKTIGRSSKSYYPASVMNSVLGGGYSSRLNQEIRIKRGLSYGAGSSFSWRFAHTNFGTRTQTKNESAAEVASVIVDELGNLAKSPIEESELIPRKAVLTGGFGRNIETNGGLVNALADLYSFGISPNSLNDYMPGVNAVTDKQIRDFVTANLYGGDIIIVGDYSLFKDDLAKRFPNIKPEVIPVTELDITRPGLRK
ncbi:MAG: insulinase family protein, partial [Acidobacteria bacterium]|nr:insulinase family protein [Acidobacteriota bacterium]